MGSIAVRSNLMFDAIRNIVRCIAISFFLRNPRNAGSFSREKWHRTDKKLFDWSSKIPHNGTEQKR